MTDSVRHRCPIASPTITANLGGYECFNMAGQGFQAAVVHETGPGRIRRAPAVGSSQDVSPAAGSIAVTAQVVQL